MTEEEQVFQKLIKAARNSLERAAKGHNDHWQPLSDALDEAQEYETEVTE
jgi:hypothetical protein